MSSWESMHVRQPHPLPCSLQQPQPNPKHSSRPSTPLHERFSASCRSIRLLLILPHYDSSPHFLVPPVEPSWSNPDDICKLLFLGFLCGAMNVYIVSKRSLLSLTAVATEEGRVREKGCKGGDRRWTLSPLLT